MNEATDSILSCYHHHLASEKRYSPRTVSSYEHDLHDFIGWLEKQARKLPDTLDAETLDRLLDIGADDMLAIRDRALMELLYSSGLRLSELVGLDANDLDKRQQQVRERVRAISNVTSQSGGWL